MPINIIILRTGIIYSIIVCAFISISCLYPSLLLSLKSRKTREDLSLLVFLNIFGLYWLVYALLSLFGWLNIAPAYNAISLILNFILFVQPIPLLFYFIKNRYLVSLYSAIGLVFFLFSAKQTYSLTTISFWGIQPGVSTPSQLIFIFGMMAPLAAVAIFKIFSHIKKRKKVFFVETITLVFVLLGTINILSGTITWNLLLIRVLYISIGFSAYFHLSGEEATRKVIDRISPRLGRQMDKVRALRIPFFAKLLALFMLLSVLPIAAAGGLLFLTFKEIIDLYIYKPLLWNLKTSKEEFLVALGNVQVQALFLILLAIIIVVIVSSIASRSIAQSLKRIGLGMKKLEEGDLDYKVRPESNDEIGDLANYFNKMGSEIKRSREIMEDWNKELEKTVKTRTKNLQNLYALSKAMGSTLNLEELLEKSVEHIPAIAGSNSLLIYLRNEKDMFEPKVNREFPMLLPFKLKSDVFGEILNSGQIVKMIDAKEIEKENRELLKPLNLKSLILVPMENKGKKTGLMIVGMKGDYTPDDIELNLLSTIADEMAIGIENANIYEKEKEAVKKLLDIDKMKTELISMVSHELRTPLTSIKGFLSHFISGTTGPINDTQMKFLKIMTSEGDHLLELIDGLLEFSKAERGASAMKKEHVEIDTLIKGIAEAMKPQVDGKKMKLLLNLSATKIKFNGNQLKIGQVIRNLIGNAIKFIKEDPAIEISTSVTTDKKEVKISVRDNGVGIEKENLSKIFDKFYQVDGSLTRKVGGLGLGLLISKEIVEAHGGKIWAESDGTGKGSTLTFTLPVIK